MKLPRTLAPSIVRYNPRGLSRFIWCVIKKGAWITAMVLSTKIKNSPLVQGCLELLVSIKVEWENKINLERLKTKVSQVLLILSKTLMLINPKKF